MGISFQNLSKHYTQVDGNLEALENVSFYVEDQEFVSIVGPSGCGKTTLLKLIAGLIKPNSGIIHYDSEPREGQLRAALVFQDQGLFPWMNVVDNIAFGLELLKVNKRIRQEAALAFMNKIGLGGFEKNYPYELSGGMKQRVALARAFLADPQILLMDEPFGALDAQTRLVLQEELLRIWRDDRKTILFVTHDIEEAIILSDRVIVMTDRPGKIRQEISIPLGRPRGSNARDDPAVKEIKWQIWKMLETEVRKDLKLES